MKKLITLLALCICPLAQAQQYNGQMRSMTPAEFLQQMDQQDRERVRTAIENRQYLNSLYGPRESIQCTSYTDGIGLTHTTCNGY